MTTANQLSRLVSAVEQTFILPKTIAGFEVSDGTDESRRHCGISEIAAGSVLKLCGHGFSKQATKVVANGRHYFVFLRDIQSAET